MKRFESKIAYEPNTGCWLWIGSLGYNGYGLFKLNRKVARAHRVSYELYVSKIPNGLQIDHLCCIRSCVNPDHLRCITQKENNLAPHSNSIVAINRRKTHCKRGHEFTSENTYIFRNSRFCRQCRRYRDRIYKKKIGKIN